MNIKSSPRHLTRPRNLNLLHSLRPKQRHSPSHKNITINHITESKYLLSLNKISNISLIINAPGIDLRASSTILPAGNQNDFNRLIPEVSGNPGDMALDNWRVPSDIYAAFYETRV